MVGKGKLTYTALVANVRLLPVDSDLAETLRMGSEHFRRRYGVSVAAEDAPILRGVVEQTLGMVPGVRREADLWGGYLAVDETSDLIVGSCAFKGAPMADGTVEIAYYTFGPYEGQGYARLWRGR
jgi:ribosomal-protein-alanine N-acetyltransferase